MLSFLGNNLIESNIETQTKIISQSYTPQKSDIQINAISPIIEDGILSEGEYEYNINWGVANWSYTIVGDMVYMALRVEALGWISFGWGGYMFAPMEDSDVATGYVDDNGVPHMDDYWSTREPGPARIAVPEYDGQQDILTFNGTQDDTTTTIEWSRKLVTGDTDKDYEIIPGVRTMVMIGWHATVDNPGWKHTGWSWWWTDWNGNPSRPRNLQASVSESRVDLTWDAPSGDGNSTNWTDNDIRFSSYKLYRSYNNQPYQLITTINDTSITSYTDTDVINAENYRYRVTATNEAIGHQESGYSNEVSVIPMGPLLQPDNLIAQVNSFNVNLSFDYPSSDGGVPVKQFKIYRSMNISGPFDLVGLNTSSLAYNDYDVINGYTYYYYVLAEHDLQTSPASNIVTTNPTGSSTPPLDIIADYSDNQVSLSWSIPESNGGYPLVSYNIYRADTLDGDYTSISSTTELNFVDSEAINGETYYYKVSAVNTVSESEFSNIQRITLALVPSTPVNMNIKSGNGNNSLSWDASDPKGDVILFYTIYRSDTPYGPFIPIATVNSLEYDDLTVVNSKSYYYLVTANNTVGESSYSNVLTGIPASVPSKPVNLFIKQVKSGIKINWDEPENNGGYFISDYSVERKSDDGVYSSYASSQSKEFIDNSFNFGTTYSYRIIANNIIGSSEYSSEVSIVPGTNPDRPENIILEMDSGDVRISWEEPNNGGNEIIGYNIYRSAKSNNSYRYIGNSKSMLYVDNVNSTDDYYYRVTAINDMGESEFSVEQHIFTGSPPNAPGNLIALVGNNESTLLWDTPEDNGSPIKYFNVYISDNNITGFELVDNCEALTYTLSDLRNNQTYYIYVTAVNELGESTRSNIVSVVPKEGYVDPSLVNNDAEAGDLNSNGLDIELVTQTAVTILSISAFTAIVFATRTIIMRRKNN